MAGCFLLRGEAARVSTRQSTCGGAAARQEGWWLARLQCPNCIYFKAADASDRATVSGKLQWFASAAGKMALVHRINYRRRSVLSTMQKNYGRWVCAFCLLASIPAQWLSCSLVLGAQSEAEQPPNVIFILADDLGYRELGSYGQEKIRTPNLDKLARQGVKLTQHYSGNAVCAPSRCVLLTGKHPGHAFVRNNKGTPPEGQWPIPDEEFTLAEAFKQAGYVTGAFGKWGLGGPQSTGRPLEQGVDRFFGYNCQSHAHSYYPSYLWDDAKHIELDNHPEVPGHASLDEDADPNDPRAYDRFKGSDYAPDRINEQALNFIRENRSRPFFLYYPSVIPHVALHVPDSDLLPYTKLGWDDPPFTRAEGYGYTPHFTPRAAYAAMISRLDRYVGRVLELLDELGLSDNTIVVFSSDNGTTHLGQEVDYEFFQSVGELRGLKGSLYEGGVRIPLLIRWPGVTDGLSPFVGSNTDPILQIKVTSPLSQFAGRTIHEPVMTTDLFYTILDIVNRSAKGSADAPPPVTGPDGESLAKILNRQQSSLGRDELCFHYPHYYPSTPPVSSIRQGRWKLLHYYEDDRVELYNLAQDEEEQHDLAKSNPQQAEKLLKALNQWREDVGAQEPTMNPSWKQE